MTYWEKRLNWIVRALAQDASVQRELFPGFVPVGEELATDFECSLIGAKEAGEGLARALEILGIDAHLDDMTAKEDMDLWMEPATLENADDWKALRAMARAAAVSLGWSTDSPGPSPAIYVGPPQGE